MWTDTWEFPKRFTCTCKNCGREFKTAHKQQGFCGGWCENVYRRDHQKRKVDVFLGARTETGDEINEMRRQLAAGRGL